ncbi:MAG: endonuclease domain-containing protein [Bacteroidetes bacterium]|nr:endonuclease domain-containing protein [Bacteroidota bacterium]
MVFIVVKDNFYFGASEEIIRRARILRKTMTKAEIKLWQHLQKNQFNGLKFRRQHPINRFIVDFYCHTLKLVIEIDGGVHQEAIQIERDENRTYELEQFGLKVIRFENNMVMTNITGVLKEIEKNINPE